MANPRVPHPSGRRGISTAAVHGGDVDDSRGSPVVPPIVQSATFYGGSGDGSEVLYTRYGNNPNQLHLARKLAELEGTASALALGSGMAATAMTLLALTGAGDHVVASRHLYGATRALLSRELPRRGVETTFVDPAGGRAWRRAIRPTTRVLFVEVPTNPTLRLFDPRPLSRLAQERGLVLVADATFASPVNLLPVKLGVDVVIHSATKYLSGHSDVVAGVVAGPDEVVTEVQRVMRLYGPVLDPHAAWLLDRGVRTLDVRVRRQNETALALARALERNDRVERVLYPGLASHPDHHLAREILRGFGGMVAFVVQGGGPAADRVASALEVARVAPSLGGVETLVSQPRHTSHADLTPEERRGVGIPDGFLRVSVGVEDAEDLVADFERALGRLED
jgi:cystathionine beta-lyase/cystathionine gamma-synthase